MPQRLPNDGQLALWPIAFWRCVSFCSFGALKKTKVLASDWRAKRNAVHVPLVCLLFVCFTVCFTVHFLSFALLSFALRDWRSVSFEPHNRYPSKHQRNRLLPPLRRVDLDLLCNGRLQTGHPSAERRIYVRLLFPQKVSLTGLSPVAIATSGVIEFRSWCGFRSNSYWIVAFDL